MKEKEEKIVNSQDSDVLNEQYSDGEVIEMIVAAYEKGKSAGIEEERRKRETDRA